MRKHLVQPIGLRLRALVGLVAMACVSHAAFANSECDAILKDGTRNTFQELRTGDLRTAFENAYCGRNSNSRGSSSGTSVGGSYAGYGLNFGQNSSDTAESRAENCGSSSGSMSDAKFQSAMTSVVDAKIVEAWQACVTQSVGVFILGTLNGDTVALTYKFKTAGSVTQATVNGDPTVVGMQCDHAVKDGTVINTGGMIQVCQRSGNGAVTVSVNTNFAPALFTIPAAQTRTEPVPKTPFDRCLGGDDDACGDIPSREMAPCASSADQACMSRARCVQNLVGTAKLKIDECKKDPTGANCQRISGSMAELRASQCRSSASAPPPPPNPR
jgi:hypothetical protein